MTKICCNVSDFDVQRLDAAADRIGINRSDAVRILFKSLRTEDQILDLLTGVR